MFVRGVVSYLGSSYDQFAGFGNVQEMPAYADLNGSAGVTLGHWDLMVFGKNLTDRYIVTGVDVARNVPETYTVAPPRTVGLEAKFSF
jgi:outer membrane receptor protein involved in Fe transport